jgi:nitrogen fixation NifU-like protein
MNLKELYQEIILDHGKNPKNKKKINGFNKEAKGYNPLCGDKVHVFLKLDKNKKVQEISFEGEGCAISIASASIMTETLKGKEFDIAEKIVENFLNMIKNNEKIKINNLNEDQKTTIASLSGVREFPMRVKCATMAWHTFVSAMK